MNEDAISKLVDRFLSWRLPDDFSPDSGISFISPDKLYPHMENMGHLWPSGTNLLNADQAREMIKYILEND